jgi:hypothetical protein
MMALNKRKAQFVATLIYLDEPQLLLLTAGTTRILAVAIPYPEGGAKFLAVTVQQNNWEMYIHGHCDLRFLYTYPRNKILYYFDLMQMEGDTVKMTVADPDIPPEHLPCPRIFASHHTTEWEEAPKSAQIENLAIDGQWEMSEFGKFYQKYADIYALISSVKRWSDHATPDNVKQRIKNEFTDKPFKGGSSYLHLFDGLLEKLPAVDRPSLRQVEYASPGMVSLRGQDITFADVKNVVKNYLGHRTELAKRYDKLYRYLSKAGLLPLSGDNFSENDPSAAYIRNEAKELSDLLGAAEFDDILALTNNNALVAAKVVLAAYRRVEESSAFFAQGRMAFQ